MRFRCIPRYKGVRLLASGRVFSVLPMDGAYDAVPSTSEYYPWILDRPSDGGQGIYWWRKVKSLLCDASLTITDTDPGGFGTITIAASGTLSRSFGGGGGGIYNDERDTEYPTFHSWTGGLVSGSDHVNAQVRLCGVGGEGAAGAPINSPGPKPFYVNEVALIPQFWVYFDFSRVSTITPSLKVASYQFASALASSASSGVDGTMDGQPFDLQIETPIPKSGGPYEYQISAPSITLTVAEEYLWT